MSDATLVSAALAGTTASVVENAITYPLEYLKVRQELAIREPGKQFVIPRFTSVMYNGLAPFAAGNALRTLLRFNVFQSATNFFMDGQQERPTAPAVVAAGMLAGLAETILMVPFESVKTTMIEASSVGRGVSEGALPPLGASGTQLTYRGKPVAHTKVPDLPAFPSTVPQPVGRRVRPPPSAPTQLQNAMNGGVVRIEGPQSMLRTVREMLRTRGFRAFVQGFNPTAIRQITNSMLRFTGWNAWTQVVAVDGEEKMSLLNVLAGSAVVAAVETGFTQPIDFVKTRMQSANGMRLYGNSLFCVYRVFVDEGYRQLWTGAGPRFARKWLSGGIMWFVYETSFAQINRSMNENPFR